MKEDQEEKIIEELKTHKFRDYDENSFRRFMLKDDQYPKSKKRGAVSSMFITVFSSFKKRLLARTFYLEEGYESRKRYCFITEVKRQLAGCSRIITKRLYAGMGIKVWKYEDEFGWQEHSCKSFAIESYGQYEGWYSRGNYDHYAYNDYKAILKKSVHKYSAYEIVKSREYQGIEGMFKYLMKYEKDNDIEMLVKMGLEHCINDMRYIKRSKKGFARLGITKPELKYLKAGITLADYRKVRNIALKQKLDEDECKKAIEFVKRGKLPNKRMLKYVIDKDVSVYDYIDYITNVDALGYQKRSAVLYPEDFTKAHDDVLKEVETRKSREIDEKIQAYAKDLEKLRMEDNGLLIRAASCQQELIDESKKLEHCVRMYDRRVASRSTAIFMIRKTDHEKEPYATLELSDKTIVQCRAYRNRVPEKEVIEFVNLWAHKNRFISCFGGK